MNHEQFFSYYNFKESKISHKPNFCANCGSSKIEPKETYFCCIDCGKLFFKNAAPVVRVLIFDPETQKYLLGKRFRKNKDFSHNKWEFIGGFLEYNENFLEGGHREVFEETGLRVEMKSVLNVLSAFDAPEYHVLCVNLLAHKIGGDLKVSEEHSELRWFLEEDIASVDLAFSGEKHMMEYLFANPGHGMSVDQRFARGDV